MLITTLLSLALFSCATFKDIYEITDTKALDIQTVFPEEIIENACAELNLNYSTENIYAILEQQFGEAYISFVTPVNDDTEIEDLLKECYVVHAAEKSYNFCRTEFKKITLENPTSGSANVTAANGSETKNILILLAAVKHLLIETEKTLNPLFSKITQFCGEKKWDSDENNQDIFIGITLLESNLLYLQESKKTFPVYISELDKKIGLF